MKKKLEEIYNILLAQFGHQNWWPDDTPFEIALGAILTQNTSWTNVEKAITNIKDRNLLDPGSLHNLPPEELAQIIKPAGYFRVKAKRLKNFLNFLFDNYQGSLENLEHVSTDMLKTQLLEINGIGPETADSILLYALNRPVFVVDTYTARIAVRHHLIEPDLDYQSLQYLFESNLTPPDTQLYNEFHALLVMIGKNYCKPKPRCDLCPLNHLPHTIQTDDF